MYMPSPVLPITPPKTDSTTLPLGSVFFIQEVAKVQDAAKGPRSELTVTQARERYEGFIVARRVMELREANRRLSPAEADHIARTELAYTPKPSDRTIAEVIATAKQLMAVGLADGNKIELFKAIDMAAERFSR